MTLGTQKLAIGEVCIPFVNSATCVSSSRRPFFSTCPLQWGHGLIVKL
jgi:hypothetical protein